MRVFSGSVLILLGLGAIAALTIDPLGMSRSLIVRDLEEIGVTRSVFHCSTANDLVSVEFGRRIHSSGLSRYGSLLSLDLTALTHPDNDLALITDVDARVLILNGAPMSDGGTHHIANMSSVSMLYADGTEITDASVENIAAMRSLSCVSLTGTNVTIDGVARLRALRPEVHVRHTTIGNREEDDEPGR